MKLKVTVNGTDYLIDVEVEEEQQQTLSPIIIGGVNTGNNPIPTRASMPAASSNAVVAPLAGSVARIQVHEGDAITSGQVLVVLEAMKMETEITAPQSGVVSAVLVSAGTAVTAGQVLLQVD